MKKKRHHSKGIPLPESRRLTFEVIIRDTEGNEEPCQVITKTLWQSRVSIQRQMEQLAIQLLDQGSAVCVFEDGEIVARFDRERFKDHDGESKVFAPSRRWREQIK